MLNETTGLLEETYQSQLSPVNSLDLHNFENYYLIEVFPNSPIGRVVSQENATDETGLSKQYRTGNRLSHNYRWLHKEANVDPLTGGNVCFITVSALTHLAIWTPLLVNAFIAAFSVSPIAWLGILQIEPCLVSPLNEAYRRIKEKSILNPEFPSGTEIPFDDINIYDALQKIIKTINAQEKLLEKYQIHEPEKDYFSTNLASTKTCLPFCESSPDNSSTWNLAEWTGFPGFFSGFTSIYFASKFCALASSFSASLIAGGICCIGTHYIATERSHRLREARLREEAVGITRVSNKGNCSQAICFFNYPNRTKIDFNNETRNELLEMYKQLYLRKEKLTTLLEKNNIDPHEDPDNAKIIALTMLR